MKISNPTNKSITIKIKGTELTVPAKGIIEGVSFENSEHWEKRIHQFLDVIEETVIICHNGQTIEIDGPALRAHLNHGDTIGACS